MQAKMQNPQVNTLNSSNPMSFRLEQELAQINQETEHIIDMLRGNLHRLVGGFPNPDANPQPSAGVTEGSLSRSLETCEDILVNLDRCRHLIAALESVV